MDTRTNNPLMNLKRAEHLVISSRLLEKDLALALAQAAQVRSDLGGFRV